jgi:hypothetical protein
MARAIMRGDKTKFVNRFLTKNPQGNFNSINEAWAAAGMTGTISKPVVDKTRAKLGLTGNLGTKSKAAPKGKAALKKTNTATATPGKSSFVKEYLHDHPDATAREVTEAWTNAGMKGAISHTVISEVRKSLGLIGKPNTSKRIKIAQEKTSASKPRGRKPVTEIEVATSRVTETSGLESSRTTILLAVESEIDRLIFTIMGLGDLPEIETALRDARRRVCKATPT